MGSRESENKWHFFKYIYQLLFVMEMCYVFYAVRTKFLNISDQFQLQRSKNTKVFYLVL
jgi:hypothetical protein